MLRAAEGGTLERAPETRTACATDSRPAGRRRLTRLDGHFVVDVLLFSAWLALVGFSAILQFIFPPATQADDATLWGWGYDAWSSARFVSLCLFMLMTLIHVLLQWSWVCNYLVSRLSRVTGRKLAAAPAERTLYGVGFLIVLLTLLGILLTAAEFAVQRG